MYSTDWVQKSTNEFQLLSNALETPIELLTQYFTPNESFFVCSVGDTPVLDKESHQIKVHGDGVTQSLCLNMDDLEAMPQHTLPAFLECAGNHRRLFDWAQGQKLNKRPEMTEVLWELGGVGMAEWSGPRLRDILTQAGVSADTVHVCPVGLDTSKTESAVKVPIPLDKALDPDTILAISMNGQPLPLDHGYPVRMIVPGWVGTYSVKWVGEIIVSKSHLWVHRNTELYVLYGDEWPQEENSPAKGAVVTEQTIKSSLVLPWNAQLTAGKQRLQGIARSPGTIDYVEWSADGGQQWQATEIISPKQKYAWVQFAFDWYASSGQHALMTRATDTEGRTQPKTVPFNNGGYLFNAIHAHPVVVSP